MATTSELVTVDIESIVTVSDKYVPLTGVFATEENLDGWVWDKRLFEDFKRNPTLYLNTIGGHAVGLKDGTKMSQWLSGSIFSTEFFDIVGFKSKGESLSWTPQVKTGLYTVLFKEKNLYSNYSHVDKFDVTTGDVSTATLRSDARLDTVSAILYRRDENFVVWPWHKYEYVSAFTDNTRKYEFTISGTTISLNQDAKIEVGDRTIVPTVDLLGNWEYVGRGSPTGRDCYTEYFPIKEGTLRVFVLEGNTVRELEQTSNLNFSGPTNAHYSVDEDLGIISLGGYQAPDLVLRESLDEDDDTVTCYIDDEAFASYPSQGVIQIGSEQILYYRKGRRSFYDCIRGWNGTTVASHDIGDIVQDIKHGQGTATAEEIYLAYEAVPRLEYEITDFDIRSCNKAPFVDTKAIANAKTNNVIQISPIETHVSELLLETDLEHLGGGVYGPIYYGTDFTRLTARALDSLANPVEGIDITIVLDSDTGALNGSLSDYTSLSNSLGEVYAIYNSPYDWDSISKEVISVTHELGGTTIAVDTLPSNLDAEEIQIYQVLKHDRIYGTVGERFRVKDLIENPTVGTHTHPHPGIIVDAVFDDAASRWESSQDPDLSTRENVTSECGGTNRGCSYVDIKFTSPTGSIWYRRKIVEAIDVFETVGTQKQKNATMFLLSPGFPSALLSDPTVSVSICYAVERDAQIWNGNLLNGVPVVLYEWNDGVMHPDGSMGAYYPVRPDTLTTRELFFEGRTLPIPQPYDIESNLGGYFVVAPDIVTLYAYCTDPVSGKVIRSNKIRVKLSIPEHLNGVDFSGVLPIPYGFTFIAEDFNVGTGLGGANFLTINPRAEGIDTFSLNVDIG